MNMKHLIAVLALVASAASASTFSYTGNLDPNDANDVRLFEFTLATMGDVNIQSWGYGGGVNGAGAIIPAGGFDPYVSLFAGIGNGATFLTSNDDGVCPPGNGAGACHDSTLNVTGLAAGSYTVALSVFDNFSFAENLGTGTLGDGFIGFGDYFDSASNQTRSSAYAIDISSGSFVPEPSTVIFLVPALVLLYTQRRRFTGSQK
jgi:hypothetical protein